MIPTFVLIIWAIIFGGPPLIWLLFRSRGYKRRLLDQPPGAGWERTTEASVDLRTGDVIEVWFRPATGERAYVRSGRRTV